MRYNFRILNVYAHFRKQLITFKVNKFLSYLKYIKNIINQFFMYFNK